MPPGGDDRVKNQVCWTTFYGETACEPSDLSELEAGETPEEGLCTADGYEGEMGEDPLSHSPSQPNALARFFGTSDILTGKQEDLDGFLYPFEKDLVVVVERPGHFDFKATIVDVELQAPLLHPSRIYLKFRQPLRIDGQEIREKWVEADELARYLTAHTKDGWMLAAETYRDGQYHYNKIKPTELETKPPEEDDENVFGPTLIPIPRLSVSAAEIRFRLESLLDSDDPTVRGFYLLHETYEQSDSLEPSTHSQELTTQLATLEQFEKFQRERRTLFQELPTDVRLDPTFQKIEQTDPAWAKEILRGYKVLADTQSPDVGNHGELVLWLHEQRGILDRARLVEFRDRIQQRHAIDYKKTQEFAERKAAALAAANLTTFGGLAQFLQGRPLSLGDKVLSFNQGPPRLSFDALDNIRTQLAAELRELPERAKPYLTAKQYAGWKDKLSATVAELDRLYEQELCEGCEDKAPDEPRELSDNAKTVLTDIANTAALYESTLLTHLLEEQVKRLETLVKAFPSPLDDGSLEKLKSDVARINMANGPLGFDLNHVIATAESLFQRIDREALRLSINMHIASFSEHESALRQTYEDWKIQGREKDAVAPSEYEAAKKKLAGYLKLIDDGKFEEAQKQFAHDVQHPDFQRLVAFVDTAGFDQLVTTLQLSSMIVVAAALTETVVGAVFARLIAGSVAPRLATIARMLVRGAVFIGSERLYSMGLVPGATFLHGTTGLEKAHDLAMDIGFMSVMLPYLEGAGKITKEIVSGATRAIERGVARRVHARLLRTLRQTPLAAREGRHSLRGVRAAQRASATAGSRAAQIFEAISGFVGEVAAFTAWEYMETRARALLTAEHPELTKVMLDHVLSLEGLRDRALFLGALKIGHVLASPISGPIHRRMAESHRARLKAIVDERTQVLKALAAKSVSPRNAFDRLLKLQRERTNLLASHRGIPEDIVKEAKRELAQAEKLSRATRQDPDAVVVPTEAATREFFEYLLRTGESYDVGWIEDQKVSVRVLANQSDPIPKFFVDVEVDGRSVGNIVAEPVMDNPDYNSPKLMISSESLHDAPKEKKKQTLRAEDVSRFLNEWMFDQTGVVARARTPAATPQPATLPDFQSVVDATERVEVGTVNGLAVHVELISAPVGDDNVRQHRALVDVNGKFFGVMQIGELQNGTLGTYALFRYDGRDRQPVSSDSVRGVVDRWIVENNRRRSDASSPRTPGRRERRLAVSSHTLDTIEARHEMVVIGYIGTDPVSFSVDYTEGERGSRHYRISVQLDGRECTADVREAEGRLWLVSPFSVRGSQDYYGDERSLNRMFRNWLQTGEHVTQSGRVVEFRRPGRTAGSDRGGRRRSNRVQFNLTTIHDILKSGQSTEIGTIDSGRLVVTILGNVNDPVGTTYQVGVELANAHRGSVKLKKLGDGQFEVLPEHTLHGNDVRFLHQTFRRWAARNMGLVLAEYAHEQGLTRRRRRHWRAPESKPDPDGKVGQGMRPGPHRPTRWRRPTRPGHDEWARTAPTHSIPVAGIIGRGWVQITHDGFAPACRININGDPQVEYSRRDVEVEVEGRVVATVSIHRNDDGVYMLNRKRTHMTRAASEGRAITQSEVNELVANWLAMNHADPTSREPARATVDAAPATTAATGSPVPPQQLPLPATLLSALLPAGNDVRTHLRYLICKTADVKNIRALTAETFPDVLAATFDELRGTAFEPGKSEQSRRAARARLHLLFGVIDGVADAGYRIPLRNEIPYLRAHLHVLGGLLGARGIQPPMRIAPEHLTFFATPEGQSLLAECVKLDRQLSAAEADDEGFVDRNFRDEAEHIGRVKFVTGIAHVLSARAQRAAPIAAPTIPAPLLINSYAPENYSALRGQFAAQTDKPLEQTTDEELPGLVGRVFADLYVSTLHQDADPAARSHMDRALMEFVPFAEAALKAGYRLEFMNGPEYQQARANYQQRKAAARGVWVMLRDISHEHYSLEGCHAYGNFSDARREDVRMGGEVEPAELDRTLREQINTVANWDGLPPKELDLSANSPAWRYLKALHDAVLVAEVAGFDFARDTWKAWPILERMLTNHTTSGSPPPASTPGVGRPTGAYSVLGGLIAQKPLEFLGGSDGTPEMRLRPVAGKAAPITTRGHGRFDVGRNGAATGTDTARAKYTMGDDMNRHHFIVSFADGQLTITDQSSTFGTYVNGHRLSQGATVELRNGDRIRAGRETEWEVDTDLPLPNTVAWQGREIPGRWRMTPDEVVLQEKNGAPVVIPYRRLSEDNLKHPNSLAIGSNSDNQVQMDGVEHFACRIEYEGDGRWSIFPVHDKVTVNRKKVGEEGYALEEGDAVTIGKKKFTYHTGHREHVGPQRNRQTPETSLLWPVRLTGRTYDPADGRGQQRATNELVARTKDGSPVNRIRIGSVDGSTNLIAGVEIQAVGVAPEHVEIFYDKARQQWIVLPLHGQRVEIRRNDPLRHVAIGHGPVHAEESREPWHPVENETAIRHGDELRLAENDHTILAFTLVAPAADQQGPRVPLRRIILTADTSHPSCIPGDVERRVLDHERDEFTIGGGFGSTWQLIGTPSLQSAKIVRETAPDGGPAWKVFALVDGVVVDGQTLQTGQAAPVRDRSVIRLFERSITIQLEEKEEGNVISGRTTPPSDTDTLVMSTVAPRRNPIPESPAERAPLFELIGEFADHRAIRFTSDGRRRASIGRYLDSRSDDDQLVDFPIMDENRTADGRRGQTLSRFNGTVVFENNRFFFIPESGSAPVSLNGAPITTRVELVHNDALYFENDQTLTFLTDHEPTRRKQRSRTPPVTPAPRPARAGGGSGAPLMDTPHAQTLNAAFPYDSPLGRYMAERTSWGQITGSMTPLQCQRIVYALLLEANRRISTREETGDLFRLLWLINWAQGNNADPMNNGDRTARRAYEAVVQRASQGEGFDMKRAIAQMTLLNPRGFFQYNGPMEPTPEAFAVFLTHEVMQLGTGLSTEAKFGEPDDQPNWPKLYQHREFRRTTGAQSKTWLYASSARSIVDAAQSEGMDLAALATAGLAEEPDKLPQVHHFPEQLANVDAYLAAKPKARGRTRAIAVAPAPAAAPAQTPYDIAALMSQLDAAVSEIASREGMVVSMIPRDPAQVTDDQFIFALEMAVSTTAMLVTNEATNQQTSFPFDFSRVQQSTWKRVLAVMAVAEEIVSKRPQVLREHPGLASHYGVLQGAIRARHPSGGSGSTTPVEVLMASTLRTPLFQDVQEILAARDPAKGPPTAQELQAIIVILTDRIIRRTYPSFTDLTNQVLVLIGLINRGTTHGFVDLGTLARAENGQTLQQLSALLGTVYDHILHAPFNRSLPTNTRHEHAVNLRHILLFAERLNDAHVLPAPAQQLLTSPARERLGVGSAFTVPEAHATQRNPALHDGPNAQANPVALLAAANAEGTWDVVTRGWRKIQVGRGQPETGEMNREEATLRVLVTDPRVSRDHFHLEQRDDGSWTLTDTSTNGTIVDGRMVHHETVPLRDRSRIRFGDTEYFFRIDISKAITKTDPGAKPRDLPPGDAAILKILEAQVPPDSPIRHNLTAACQELRLTTVDEASVPRIMRQLLLHIKDEILAGGDPNIHAAKAEETLALWDVLVEQRRFGLWRLALDKEASDAKGLMTAVRDSQRARDRAPEPAGPIAAEVPAYDALPENLADELLASDIHDEHLRKKIASQRDFDPAFPGGHVRNRLLPFLLKKVIGQLYNEAIHNPSSANSSFMAALELVGFVDLARKRGFENLLSEDPHFNDLHRLCSEMSLRDLAASTPPASSQHGERPIDYRDASEIEIPETLSEEQLLALVAQTSSFGPDHAKIFFDRLARAITLRVTDTNQVVRWTLLLRGLAVTTEDPRVRKYINDGFTQYSAVLERTLWHGGHAPPRASNITHLNFVTDPTAAADIEEAFREHPSERSNALLAIRELSRAGINEAVHALERAAEQSKDLPIHEMAGYMLWQVAADDSAAVSDALLDVRRRLATDNPN